MAIRLSTGARNAMLDATGLAAGLEVAQINIYTGSQPTDADTAASGTLLASITVDGGATGVTFDAAASGVLSKAAAETWQGTAAASGTAGWFRLFLKTDSPSGASTTLVRVDGSVAVSGGDLNISNTSITSGAVQTITEFDITMPAS
ncbi:MAG: hypothetical protein WD355_02260 [Balneolaceae bacterium]